MFLKADGCRLPTIVGRRSGDGHWHSGDLPGDFGLFSFVFVVSVVFRCFRCLFVFWFVFCFC